MTGMSKATEDAYRYDEQLAFEAGSVLYPDLNVKLVGQDGNAFAIIGKVNRAIRDKVGVNAASAFYHKAIQCKSYDDLLRLVQMTVNVS